MSTSLILVSLSLTMPASSPSDITPRIGEHCDSAIVSIKKNGGEWDASQPFSLIFDIDLFDAHSKLALSCNNDVLSYISAHSFHGIDHVAAKDQYRKAEAHWSTAFETNHVHYRDDQLRTKYPHFFSSEDLIQQAQFWDNEDGERYSISLSKNDNNWFVTMLVKPAPLDSH